MAQWLALDLVGRKAEEVWTVTRGRETLIKIFADTTLLSEWEDGSHSLNCKRMKTREFKSKSATQDTDTGGRFWIEEP